MSEDKLENPHGETGTEVETDGEVYVGETDINEIVDKKKESVTSDISEDHNRFFEHLFSKSEFIREIWDKTIIIDGRISNVDEKSAYIECLMDEREGIIKEKIFPKDLLRHIFPLEVSKYIRIVISKKMGSLRYDFYDATNLNINKDAFEVEDVWNELENFEMDDPV